MEKKEENDFRTFEIMSAFFGLGVAPDFGGSLFAEDSFLAEFSLFAEDSLLDLGVAEGKEREGEGEGERERAGEEEKMGEEEVKMGDPGGESGVGEGLEGGVIFDALRLMAVGLGGGGIEKERMGLELTAPSLSLGYPGVEGGEGGG